MAPMIDATKVDEKSPSDRDVVLRVLYACSSFIAAFQVIWGLGKLPVELKLAASTLPLDGAEKLIGSTLATTFGARTEEGGILAARALVTKYYGQTFVFVTHILPAPLWSAIVPFQLHPASRSPGLKKLHRTLGSTFFFLSSMMMVGFSAIMGKGLDIRPGQAWFKGAQGKTIREMPGLLSATIPASFPFLFGSAAWFTYTMYRSLRAAWGKRFAEHEEWAMRHIASGQWVGLMRIFLAPGFPRGISTYGDTQEVLSSVFLGCGMSAWVVCVSAAELAVTRVRANREVAKAARIAKRKKAEEQAPMAADLKELGA